jgi:glycosyltransferase involved in cell wall biosynthesis
MNSIFDLIYIVKQLKGKVGLTLVGDGPDLNRARELVGKYSLEKNITFTGQLPHESLGPLFANSDLITVPSNNNYEGFPQVIMEAWSYHKPVIVSNVGGINALVKNNKNGLIISPGSVTDLSNSIAICLESSVVFEIIKLGAQIMAQFSIQAYWIKKMKEALNVS